MIVSAALVSSSPKWSCAMTPEIGPDSREHERELGRLGEQEAREGRGPQRVPEKAPQDRDEEALDGPDEEQQHERDGDARHDDPRVHEHAHRDEEQPRKDVPEGDRLAHDLVGQIRVGDERPGEERAEGE